MSDPTSGLPQQLQLTGVENDAFHDTADTDTGPLAQHHTLGQKAGQAAPGDHAHPDLQAQIDSINSTLTVLENDVSALQLPPTCRIDGDTVTSIPDSAWTSVNLYTEQFKVGVTHSAGAAAVTCPTAGKYLAIGHVGFDFNVTGARRVGFAVNGIDVAQAQRIDDAPASIAPILHTSALLTISAGQTVALRAFQNSGGALNTTTNTSFQLLRVSD